MLQTKIAEKINKLKKMKKNKKGFTLIELIVVIAIIGVLAALLVPSMMGYVNDARASKNDANARTVYTSAQAVQTSLQNPYKATVEAKVATIIYNDGVISTPVGIVTGTGVDADGKTFDTEFQKLQGNAMTGSFQISIDSTGNIVEVIYSTNKTETFPADTTNTAIYGKYPR